MPSTPEMMMTTAIDANAAQVVVAGMKMRTLFVGVFYRLSLLQY
jgi:hypothetical protein